MTLTAIHDFIVGTHGQTRAVAGGGLALDPGAEAGEWLSPVYRTTGPLDWAVVSWNGRGRLIEASLRVATAGGWSPWFSFGAWSETGDRFSIGGQTVTGVGKLDTDTLLLERPFREWQVKVRLAGAALDRLFVATALRTRAAGTAEPDFRAAWGKALELTWQSQYAFPNGGGVWCSPVSLAMTMGYWGVTASIPYEVVPGVYDREYDGHGNWPFNTAYAGARGFIAYVDRLPGYAALERWIAKGVPVIASVVYKQEWLPEAPISQTGGHLLVVVGFTASGDVIVGDPAGSPNTDVRRIYPRESFRRAWLDRGGVVYILQPHSRLESAQ